jgi:hypothetical protein
MRVGQRKFCRDIHSRKPTYSLGLQSPPLLLQESVPRVAQHSFSPITFLKAGATSATRSNLVPWRAGTRSAYLHL